MPTHVLSQHWKKYATKHCKTTDPKQACNLRTSRHSIILDCDAIKKDKKGSSGLTLGKINDCLIFEKNGTLNIGVVEIKGKWYKIEHTLAQLNAGADLARKILADSKFNSKFQIYLIIVAPAHPVARRRMAYLMAKSLGRTQYIIKRAKCKDTFSSVRKTRLSR